MRIMKLSKNQKGFWSGLSALPPIENLIDVGIGPEGTPGLYRFFPSARKIMIDPLIESKKAVENEIKKNPKNIFIQLALSSYQGEMDIYIREPLSRSGSKKKSCEKDSSLKIRKVKVDTLDNVISKIDLRGPIGLKIDTEGSELEILDGGHTLVNSLAWVILELSISQNKFEGSKTFEEVINYMSEKKFRVIGIRTSGSGTDHCDVAFSR